MGYGEPEQLIRRCAGMPDAYLSATPVVPPPVLRIEASRAARRRTGGPGGAA